MTLLLQSSLLDMLDSAATGGPPLVRFRALGRAVLLPGRSRQRRLAR